MSGIDGDPISGLCTVGSINSFNLRWLVMAPMCFYLALGTVFLMAGFVALFKIRNAIKIQSRSYLKTDKLEKLMIRIGIFGVLYTVPATIVVACLWYELVNRELWAKAHNCPCIDLPNPSQLTHQLLSNQFKSNSQFLVKKDPKTYLLTGSENSKNSIELHPNPPDYINASPEFAVFMLKYFMSLVVGITSGFWIWSNKTIDSWRACFQRLFIGQKPQSTIPYGVNFKHPSMTTGFASLNSINPNKSVHLIGRSSMINGWETNTNASDPKIKMSNRLLPQTPLTGFNYNQIGHPMKLSNVMGAGALSLNGLFNHGISSYSTNGPGMFDETSQSVKSGINQSIIGGRKSCYPTLNNTSMTHV